MDNPYLVCSDETVLNYTTRFELLRDYNALMTRLHSPEFETTVDSLHERFHAASELQVFIFMDNQLIATAQGSLACPHGRRYVYINDVVVHDDYEGKGFGRILMTSLMLMAVERWGHVREPLRFQLTNSPSKGNARFYESLGFKSRTKENKDETVVWVKYP